MTELSLAQRAARRAVDARVRTSEQDVRRLLDVGLELMTAGGTDAPPRIADIVKAAGLSNQAFYRYFASKEDLVAAIVDDGERRLVAYVQRQVEAAPADECLRVFVESVTSQASDPSIAAATRAVLWNASRSLDATGARSRQLHELLAALLVEPLRERGSTDPERDAAVITGAVTSAMLDALSNNRPPSAADVEHLLAFCRAGLART
ncbi:MAG: betI 7 [Frankiales bacterium]|jgi:AcrR family transcriptional regulator|nr:betI 7 [Frankiales bacterium]